jgi:hypothetical protein
MSKHTTTLPALLLALLLAVAWTTTPVAFAADSDQPTTKSATTPKPVQKGGVALSCALDREEILVGQPITCKVTARWKPPVQVRPFAPAKTLGDFEVLRTKETPIATSPKDGTKSQEFEIQFTCFDVGEKSLPPFEVQYSNATTETLTASTNPRTIVVKSYVDKLAKESKGPGEVALRGIKPPLEMPFPLRRTLITAAICAGALLLLVLAVWLVRKWLLRPVKKEEYAPPPLAPDVEALQALAQLELEDAAQREAVKPYYSRLSEILRRYLGRRYFFDALEMTSSELMERARALDWNTGLLQTLSLDTTETDSVKFARYVPAHPLRVNALERVRQVVMETRVVEQAPESAAPDQKGGEHHEPNV